MAKIYGDDGVDAELIGLDDEADVIVGGTGNETIYGGEDNLKDFLSGGEGSDEYLIRDLKDVIIETGTDSRDVDIVKLTGDFDNNLIPDDIVSYALNNAKIEVLDGADLYSGAKLTGNVKTSTMVIGSEGDDTISGGAAIDLLVGNDGADQLFGGNDTLADSLQGGFGNDEYILQDTKDIIEDEDGDNAIKLSASFKGSSFSLSETELYDYSGANIAMIDASMVSKSMTLVGNANSETMIFGGKGSDTIRGGAGMDSIDGGSGNDYIIGDAENDDSGEGDGSNRVYKYDNEGILSQVTTYTKDEDGNILTEDIKKCGVQIMNATFGEVVNANEELDNYYEHTLSTYTYNENGKVLSHIHETFDISVDPEEVISKTSEIYTYNKRLLLQKLTVQVAVLI